ncbi:MAG: PTS sugar transporter subunit IIA [Candidatus Eisenbacteria bacterium]|nr:PTS sugar transporter subunit IIA [Candidatus Eisenbacteria bacterium]
MLLSELLAPAAITTHLRASNKRDAIDELVCLLESAHGLESHGEILDHVLRRESMMSTGIGNGVAIPHGKARAVDRMLASCAVSVEGVDFDSVDGERAHLFILLVSPENVGTPHVKVLANISRLLKEESVRTSLRDAGNANEFMAALRSAEARFLTVPS